MLKISNREFNSRLFLGTGKFRSNTEMQKAIAASGTEMVTVAMKRIELNDDNDDMLSHIKTTAYSSCLTPAACATPRRLCSQHKWRVKRSAQTG